MVMPKPSGVPAVEIAPELKQPLEDLARASGQSPARIVDLALTEYLERQLRPDRKTSGTTSSYIEMTVREELHDIF
jgi:predicted transcriptional regulator